MGVYLSLVSVILLGLVAGLLLALWFQLRAWRMVAKDAPLLAETLTSQLMNARTGLGDLKKALVAQGPELERLLSEAGKARVELQFLLQRADQVAGRMEATTPAPQAPEALPETSVEKVASANGAASTSGTGAMPPAAGDPLEELLAGLNKAAEVPVEDRSAVRRRRVGPVTQAELDLQAEVQGASLKGGV